MVTPCDVRGWKVDGHASHRVTAYAARMQHAAACMPYLGVIILFSPHRAAAR